MDSQTTVQALKDRVADFCDRRDWGQFHNPKDLAIGLITEAAELLEHFRFQSPAQIEALLGDQRRKTQLAHELADVLYFALRLAERCHIDLADALAQKLALNEQRYPVDKARGRNAKYPDL